MVASVGHVGEVLFVMAALVIAAKVGGLFAVRCRQPAVLGELLVGIGAANILPLVSTGAIAHLRDDEALRTLAEIGGLILLFDVGLESDIRSLVKAGVSAVLVALIGVVTPFVLGMAASVALQPEANRLLHVFLGASLTATSVGVTARVLKDMRVGATPESQTILGAAVLDDVLGLVLLAVITGFVTADVDGAAGPSAVGAMAIFGKATLFVVLAAVGGHYPSKPLARLASYTRHEGFLLVLGLALCFTMAYVAEAIGLAGIMGAFSAGVLLDPYGTGVRSQAEERTLAESLHPLSTVFVPLFFVVIGLQVDLASMLQPWSMLLGSVLVVAAIAGKLVAGLGVVERGASRLVVGVGMVPRGEVGLVFAGIGTQLRLDGKPLLDQATFSALVVVVLVTTLVTPVGLRILLGRRSDATAASEHPLA